VCLQHLGKVFYSWNSHFLLLPFVTILDLSIPFFPLFSTANLSFGGSWEEVALWALDLGWLLCCDVPAQLCLVLLTRHCLPAWCLACGLCASHSHFKIECSSLKSL
jgi:hypothetical protein